MQSQSFLFNAPFLFLFFVFLIFTVLNSGGYANTDEGSLLCEFTSRLYTDRQVAKLTQVARKKLSPEYVNIRKCEVNATAFSTVIIQCDYFNNRHSTTPLQQNEKRKLLREKKKITKKIRQNIFFLTNVLKDCIEYEASASDNESLKPSEAPPLVSYNELLIGSNMIDTVRVEGQYIHHTIHIPPYIENDVSIICPCVFLTDEVNTIGLAKINLKKKTEFVKGCNIEHTLNETYTNSFSNNYLWSAVDTIDICLIDAINTDIVGFRCETNIFQTYVCFDYGVDDLKSEIRRLRLVYPTSFTDLNVANNSSRRSVPAQSFLHLGRLYKDYHIDLNVETKKNKLKHFKAFQISHKINFTDQTNMFLKNNKLKNLEMIQPDNNSKHINILKGDNIGPFRRVKSSNVNDFNSNLPSYIKINDSVKQPFVVNCKCEYMDVASRRHKIFFMQVFVHKGSTQKYLT